MALLKYHESHSVYGCLQDGRSHWDTFDYTLVRIKLYICLIGCSERSMQRQLDCDKLPDSIYL